MKNLPGEVCKMSRYDDIMNRPKVTSLVQTWLEEDTPSFDYGGFVVGNQLESASLLCKSPGVVCGVPFFNEVFAQLGCKVEWYIREGAYVQPVTKIASVTGSVKNILAGERVALNCIARASGVATLARHLNEVKVKSGWHGEIAGTRKTTPGFRMVEKYSLLVGGISTHRYDLSSMVMLKDNHIWSCGSVSGAVLKARSVCGFSLKIEVECRSKEEAIDAISAGADIIMLDNFSADAAKQVAHELKQKWPHVIIEASGGITFSEVNLFMSKYIDVISLGKLTQGYETVDFSLKIDKEGHDPENVTVTI